jgi:hypothetical protein
MLTALVIVHASSEKGFVSGEFLNFKSITNCGDFHNEMNYEIPLN